MVREYTDLSNLKMLLLYSHRKYGLGYNPNLDVSEETKTKIELSKKMFVTEKK